MAPAGQSLGQKGAHGGLAVSAHGEVPDRDDWQRGFLDMKKARLVELPADSCQGAPQPAQGPQGRDRGQLGAHRSRLGMGGWM